MVTAAILKNVRRFLSIALKLQEFKKIEYSMFNKRIFKTHIWIPVPCLC